MGEIRQPVQFFMVSKICDKCDEVMEKVGDEDQLAPYNYKCNKCDSVETSSEIYPYLKYFLGGES